MTPYYCQIEHVFSDSERSRLRKPVHDSVRSFLIDLPIAFRNNFKKVHCGWGGRMDIQTKYGWQELYATARLETDWLKIEEKIRVAENGITVRLHEFSMNHGGTPEENQAIEDALNGLIVLRKEVAAWQESKRAN
jgi:hypothetical protein